jgi:hypothetical protein
VPKARAIKTAEQAARIPADEEVFIDIGGFDEPAPDIPAVDVETLAAHRPAPDITRAASRGALSGATREAPANYSRAQPATSSIGGSCASW